MSWRTNTILVALRSVSRKLGLNRWIASKFSAGYEAAYERELSAAIKAGDCLWDVGANVGYYTRLFGERTGTGGRVFAFEPSPVNFSRLSAACSGQGHIRLLPCGLGKQDGTCSFQQGSDDLGASSRVTGNSSGGTVVPIRAGDSLVADESATAPAVMKIDVEGLELEVLKGMPKLLADPRLRVIGIEVHFGILEGIGQAGAPREIENLLRAAGFRFTWPDTSHILAVRKP
ncbi:MAG: FkbM family methyltransferase [Planctomycetota bacterium]